MKLEHVTIENYRAIQEIDLSLDPTLTVLHGPNGYGKTSVLNAIATGFGSIPMLLPEVSSVGFRKIDWRGQAPLRVALRAVDGTEWDRRRFRPPGISKHRTLSNNRMLKKVVEEIVAADQERAEPIDLPIVAFYDADRAVSDKTPTARRNKMEFVRYAALEGALRGRTDFSEFFTWFYFREDEELREQKERKDFNYRLRELDAVRKAIERMVSGVSEPRTKLGPPRLTLFVELLEGEREELELDQLSGGYRIVLALVADLARRMALGNPHLDDPLGSEAVVLIDEVDLHLHPEWQQRILVDLMRTFPNAQFIVSTHSPQVLTTVNPKHIVHLHRKEGGIVATQCPPSTPTYGAEAGGVLDAVMGVRERPTAEHNEFVKKLDEYMSLVYEGRGRGAKAVALRENLEALSARDRALDLADLEMERQDIFQRLGAAGS